MHTTSLSTIPALARAISALAAILLFALSIGAFALSFEALRDLAAHHGVAPMRAWLWPAIMDGAIVVFSLAALRLQLLGHPSRYEMMLVFVATAASCGFNIIHSMPDTVSRLVAVTPPLLIFLGFEVLLRLIRSEVQTRRSLSSVDDNWNDDMPNGRVSPTLENANAARFSTVQERRELAAQLTGEGQTPKQIAKRLGVSIRTIRRDLAASATQVGNAKAEKKEKQQQTAELRQLPA